MEYSMEDPQKLKTELLYEPTILLVSIYLKELKLVLQRDIYAPVFITALITIAKI